MTKKPIENIYIYRTIYENVIAVIFFLALTFATLSIIKEKYVFCNKLIIIKHLFFLTLAFVGFVYSLYNFFYKFLKRKSPILLLTACSLTYEHNDIIKKSRFTGQTQDGPAFFNPFIQESILWTDIESITIEKYKRVPGRYSGSLYFCINKKKNTESILISLKSVDLPLYYLCKFFKEYKPIKIYPNSFLIKIKSSRYYTYYYSWRYLFWLALAICYCIYKLKY